MDLNQLTKKELVEFGDSRGISLDINDKKEVILKELLANDYSDEYQTNNLDKEENDEDTEVGALKELINTIWDYIGRGYVALILIVGMSPLIFLFWVALQPGSESQCWPLGSMC